MIKINLLPSEMRGKSAREKKAPGPLMAKLAVNGSVAAVVLVCAVAIFLFYSKVSTVTQQAKEISSEVTKKQKLYDAKLSENQQMKGKWDRMQVQQEILDVLVPDNPLLWSEKINMLANLIPSGVYITRLEVEESTEMVETEHSKQLRDEYEKKKAKLKEGEVLEEPEEIKKPVIKQTLILKAIATGRDRNERFDKVREFARRMKDYSTKNGQGQVRRFMDNFQPEITFGTGEATVHDGTDVWAFEMRLLTQPFGLAPIAPKGEKS